MRNFIAMSILMLATSAVRGDDAKKPCLNVGGTDEPGGTVTGIVKYAGDKPEVQPIKEILGNAFCANCYPGGKVPNEEKFAFGKNGSEDILRNVLVYVSKGLEGKSFTPPKTPVVLDQVNCVYTPHVVGVMVGQTLEIRNSDATRHPSATRA